MASTFIAYKHTHTHNPLCWTPTETVFACVCVHAYVYSCMFFVSSCTLFTSLMAQYWHSFLCWKHRKWTLLNFIQDKQGKVGRRRNQVTTIKSSCILKMKTGFVGCWSSNTFPPATLLLAKQNSGVDVTVCNNINNCCRNWKIPFIHSIYMKCGIIEDMYECWPGL